MPSINRLISELIMRPYLIFGGGEETRELKYYASLCLIFYNEEPFLKEWLDFHLVIGIEHFYLYNNNSTDSYLSILNSYINNGYVTLIDWPQLNSQTKAYKHCLENFKDESKWIGFIDADEFICLKKDTDIRVFLKHYEKFPSVSIPWLMFGTNGKVEYDYRKNVIEQYYTCAEKLGPTCKYIVNTKYSVENWDDPGSIHNPIHRFKILWGLITVSVKSINEKKHFLLRLFVSRKNSTIQLNHYYSKALLIALNKTTRRDAVFANPVRNIDKIFENEYNCTSTDYHITRFVAKMKFKQLQCSSHDKFFPMAKIIVHKF